MSDWGDKIMRQVAQVVVSKLEHLLAGYQGGGFPLGAGFAYTGGHIVYSGYSGYAPADTAYPERKRGRIYRWSAEQVEDFLDHVGVFTRIITIHLTEEKEERCSTSRQVQEGGK